MTKGVVMKLDRSIPTSALPVTLALVAVAGFGHASSPVDSTLGPGGRIPEAPCEDFMCDSGPVWNVAPYWPAIISPVTVPRPIDRVTSVEIIGLQHYWRGDVHFYLENPAGERFNIIVRPGSHGSPYGDGDGGHINFGTYVIVESGGASLQQGGANIDGGTYDQYLNHGTGLWTSTAFPIANLPLSSISGAAGTWKLHMRSWYPKDDGSVVGWRLHGENDGTTTSFCFGDSSTAPCPCLNYGAPRHGCANSVFSDGGFLTGYGTASVGGDLIHFEARNLTSSVCVFFQGDAQMAETVIDDGLGCVAGNLIRIGTKGVVNARATYPQSGDTPISVKGAIGPLGGTRYYQAYYRNSAPGFCPPASSNRTNGLVVTWAP